ncbi:hypothetical protein ABPG74_022489 [Tetrahymena malaccensis]
MKQVNLILFIFAIFKFVFGGCIDPNSSDHGCICKAGYYGPSQDQNSSSQCTQCPSGTFTVSSTNTIQDCEICVDANAINNKLTPPVCFCKAGFYGDASSNCKNCPLGTTSAQSTSTSTITVCNQCIDDNAYNTGGQNPFCLCKTGYQGTALFAGSCMQCSDNNQNAPGCLGQVNNSANQNQSAKVNENNLYLYILIALFFIIQIIFIIWVVKKYRSTLQDITKYKEIMRASQQELISLKQIIITNQSCQTQIINANQPIQINQNDIQILQKNDSQAIEEQSLSQQTIQMIKNCNDDIQKNQN